MGGDEGEFDDTEFIPMALKTLIAFPVIRLPFSMDEGLHNVIFCRSLHFLSLKYAYARENVDGTKKKNLLNGKFAFCAKNRSGSTMKRQPPTSRFCL